MGKAITVIQLEDRYGRMDAVSRQAVPPANLHQLQHPARHVPLVLFR